jgi:hypothetical protein
MEWYSLKRTLTDRPNGRTGVFRYHWNSGRAEQFDEFLRRIEPPGPPALYFSHIIVPHFPWCFLPSGRKYTPDDGRLRVQHGASDESSETWSSDELAVLHAYQRYLLQVGYADHLLGQLMERLRATNLFDRCLLIVMADHGVSFRPGLSRRLPVDESLPDIVSIPLFIKLTQQHEGGTSDRNVESIDVLPTILDVLGLGESPEIDGSSLLDASRPERAQKQFFDDTRTVTLDATFRSKQATCTRMLQCFGDGSEPERLFRIGPYGELVGRPAQEFAASDPVGVTLDLVKPARSPTNEPVAIVPCYFSGRVKSRSGTGHPTVLAIAVNGTIQAVTRTYTDKKISDTWSAMVPETAFETGPNEVQIFAVSTVDEHITLQPALSR